MDAITLRGISRRAGRRLLVAWAFVLAFAVTTTGAGCASRHAVQEGSRLRPWNDLYNRNWIVAGPTLVGNVAGACVGAPFYLLIGVGAHYVGGCRDRDDSRACAVADDVAVWALLAPALAAGAIVGTPFIPLSYLFPEDPVNIGK